MSKTLLLLILLFFLSVGGFFYVKYIFLKNPLPALSHFSSSPPLNPQATLFFSPESFVVSSGQLTSVNVMFESKTTFPTTIQFELSYDPMTLSNIQIYPGNYFPNPEILLQNIDEKSGRISYAISSESNTTQQMGTIATISFIPYAASPKQTSLHLLPKTSIKGGNDANLIATSAATLTILAPQASPEASLINK
jgi:hypothetical protein